MPLEITLDALFILHTLRQARFDAFLVGGAVRDLLLHTKSVTDYDFTTNATPEQVLALFPESFYENEFGTVMITPTDLHMLMKRPESDSVESSPVVPRTRIIDVAHATKLHVSLQNQQTSGEGVTEGRSGQTAATHNYEITTYRSDGVYHDHRRPATVTWGTTIEEDLSRRDFTINALALAIDDTFLSSLAQNWQAALPTVSVSENDYQIIDPHDGQQDLADNLIKTVGDPVRRFEEDALRMLRAIRFAVQLNMRIDETTYDAISTQASSITHISWERIRDELLKMLGSSKPATAVEMLDQTGLLACILPELQEGKGVGQAGHHTTDVWTHSIDALAACPSQDPVVRLATLLHDVAKPRTLQFLHGKPTFYNHEIVGSRVASSIAKRLRLSKLEQQRVFTLVRYHMFTYQPTHTDASIRRFMRRVGLENVDDILDLREADRLGSGARKTSWRLEEMKQRMIEQLHQPMEVTDLAINGHDVMEELHVKPGPIIGDLLKQLLEIVLEKPELNTKEELLKQATIFLGERE